MHARRRLSIATAAGVALLALALAALRMRDAGERPLPTPEARTPPRASPRPVADPAPETALAPAPAPAATGDAGADAGTAPGRARSRGQVRALLAIAFETHLPGRALSDVELDELTDATLRLREAQSTLRSLPERADTAARRAAARERLVEAIQDFTYVGLISAT